MTAAPFTTGAWSKGLAHWTDEESRTAFLSVAFTWRLPDVRTWATYYQALGYRVRAGGPATFTAKAKKYLEGFADLGGAYPDAIARQNPMATTASRGCDRNCWHCIVPAMEGRFFSFLPDFPVRPVLTDNNLSGLPVDYQRHIIERYRGHSVPLLDANSGFEPKTFDEDCFERWREINRGPWRFAFDDCPEREDVRRVMAMLRRRGVSPRDMQVYVLIGNEPFAECMGRIREVIDWGGEPHVQPFMKLNTLVKVPHARHDWTVQRLREVARWANRRLWRKTPDFADYDGTARTRPRERYVAAEGLFR